MTLRRLLFILTFTFSLWLFADISPSYAQYFNPYQENYQGWGGDNIKRSPIRAVLNKFSLTISSGYGRTIYSHEVKADLLESDTEQIMLGNYSLNGNQLTYEGAVNWLNATQSESAIVDINDYNFVNQDTVSIRYRGPGNSLPINLILTFDINRFRIGGGVSAEYHKISSLKPISGAHFDYTPNISSTLFLRYFLNMSARVYDYKGWSYNAEIQVGKMKYGSGFSNAVMQKGIYFNIGFPFEYELSEYFFIVIKPSVDIKNYSVSLPAIEGSNLPSFVQHNQMAFYMHVGVRLKFPEIPRCKVKSCRTQLKHVHGSHEFRGQSFYKEQNPKIGELYPGFSGDKLKNRKKINKGY